MPTAAEGGALTNLGDTKVVLVDTPGFDDTHKSDYVIFTMVAEWLKTTSVAVFFLRRSNTFTNLTGRALSKVDIAGLIYLHRISDNRMAGTPLKNLNMFQELCGKKIMSNVTMMTTMWDETPKNEAERREGELRTYYLKEFLRLGAKLARFENSVDSAAETLRPLVSAWRYKVGGPRSIVRLQKEVTTYGLRINETSAARTIQDEVEELMVKRQNVYDKLEALLAENEDHQHDAELQILLGRLAQLLAELERAQKHASHLKLPFASHLNRLFARARRITKPMLDLVRDSFVGFRRM